MSDKYYTSEIETGCPFCGQYIHCPPIFDDMSIGCLQLPRDDIIEIPKNYHEFSYFWQYKSREIISLSFSFIYNESIMRVQIYYKEDFMIISGKEDYICTIPRIILPDFPKLIDFKSKLKKLLVFA